MAALCANPTSPKARRCPYPCPTSRWTGTCRELTRSSWPLCEKARLREGHLRRRRAGAKAPRGQETDASGAFLCAAHGGLRENRVTMLRLPRAAHYSICDLLCARDAACLSETASQWSRVDDPRHAAFFACLADRVARARAVIAARRHGTTDDGSSDDEQLGYVVPGKTIASMLEFLDAVERRDWIIKPTGRDGDCSGQLRKIIRSYDRDPWPSFSSRLKDGGHIVFPPGSYRFKHIVKLYIHDVWCVQRMPQITLRGVGGPSKALLYADTNTSFCLFHIRGPTDLQSSVPNPVIQFSGLAFRNDSGGRTQRNSIVCCQGGYPKIHRVNDCHVRTLRYLHRRQNAGGHPVRTIIQCAKMKSSSYYYGGVWSRTDSESEEDVR